MTEANHLKRRVWLSVALAAAAITAVVILRPLIMGPETPKSPSHAGPHTNDASKSLTDQNDGVAKTNDTRDGTNSDQPIFDPALDGWASEALSTQATAQLSALAKLIENPQAINPDSVSPFIVDGFNCGPLRPKVFKTAFEDPHWLIQRAEKSPSNNERFQGVNGFAEQLQHLVKPFVNGKHGHGKFKIVKVELDESHAKTTALFQASATTPSGTVQQSATWHARWRVHKDQPPRLISINIEKYEQVTNRTPNGTTFVDVTQSTLGHNDSFQRQLTQGTLFWKKRLVSFEGFYNYDAYGGAVGDVNGDGLDDLYVCQRRGLPNRLFVQNPDGTATDRSAEAGVDWLDHTSSVLFLDLDNDGDQDLAVGLPNRIIVMENDGTGKFKQRVALEMDDEDLQSLTAADYDNDGDLDFFLCMNFRHPDKSRGLPAFTYTDANEGAENVLFRNEGTPKGNWVFTDATEEVGLGVGKHRRSLAAAWEDFDDDGDIDLYVSNDFGPNCLYRNDGGKFVEIASERGVIDYGSGMSAAWGDYNRDGHMDLYVSNMFSSAGSRITSQQKFKPDTDEKTRSLFARFAKGNSLFQSKGDGTFREIGAPAAVEMARWAWGSIFVDINNDGWEDIYVANGYITNEQDDDL